MFLQIITLLIFLQIIVCITLNRLIQSGECVFSSKNKGRSTNNSTELFRAFLMFEPYAGNTKKITRVSNNSLRY